MSDREATESAWRRWHDDDVPVRIGASACLCGAGGRHEGGHKHDRYLSEVPGPVVEVALAIQGPSFLRREVESEEIVSLREQVYLVPRPDDVRLRGRA